MPVTAAYIVPHPPLIIPQVGNGREKEISTTALAYQKVAEEISQIQPETIIFISPHSIMYQDYIHISPGSYGVGDFTSFGVHGVTFSTTYDTEFVKTLARLCHERHFPAGTLGEKEPDLDHGVMVPMYFINQKYTGYESVRISLSGLNHIQHYQMGQYITKVVEKLNRKAVIIASGDLSHRLLPDGPYGYDPAGPVFDKAVCQAIEQGDFSKFLEYREDNSLAAGECGLRSFIMMAGALDKTSVSAKLLSYEGPFGVGYAIGSFHVGPPDETRDFLEGLRQYKKGQMETVRSQESLPVSLARQALESYVTTQKTIKPPKNLTDPVFQIPKGVFVSIKKDGQLRGCIGTTSPTRPTLAEEIIRNAISAGCQDPRFQPVEEFELEDLVYSVDLLDPAEPVSSLNQLDVKKYGIIVTSGVKRGLLLPNLDGIDTVAQQISVALSKAQIESHEDYDLERFQVRRYH